MKAAAAGAAGAALASKGLGRIEAEGKELADIAEVPEIGGRFGPIKEEIETDGMFSSNTSLASHSPDVNLITFEKVFNTGAGFLPFRINEQLEVIPGSQLSIPHDDEFRYRYIMPAALLTTSEPGVFFCSSGLSPRNYPDDLRGLHLLKLRVADNQVQIMAEQKLDFWPGIWFYLEDAVKMPHSIDEFCLLGRTGVPGGGNEPEELSVHLRFVNSNLESTHEPVSLDYDTDYCMPEKVLVWQDKFLVISLAYNQGDSRSGLGFGLYDRDGNKLLFKAYDPQGLIKMSQPHILTNGNILTAFGPFLESDPKEMRFREISLQNLAIVNEFSFPRDGSDGPISLLKTGPDDFLVFFTTGHGDGHGWCRRVYKDAADGLWKFYGPSKAVSPAGVTQTSHLFSASLSEPNKSACFWLKGPWIGPSCLAEARLVEITEQVNPEPTPTSAPTSTPKLVKVNLPQIFK